ncbi:MAG: heavy metal translocating P-type ATPase [Candidatus Binatia bacterium]
MAGACAHCGLPLGRRPLAATVDGTRASYCCFGCVLAQQVTRARGDDGRAAAVLVRLGLAVFFAMNVMMVTLPTYVPAVYGGEGATTDGPLFVLLRWLAMAFAAPVLVLLGGPVLAAAWQAARRGVVNADALVVLGTAAAYALSVVNTLAGRPAVYYDTAVMLLVLVTLGRYLDARARAEAGARVRSTLAGQPARARREHDGRVDDVAPSVLVPGDVVLVAPGDAVPTDGVVLSGSGGVNEAAVTGEAAPVAKGPGDRVAGGTCSVDGTFRVRVRVPAAESATARIRALVDTALRDRTRAERIADRAAAVLVPVVLTVATGAGLCWGRVDGADRGVLVALAVLVVACPCGLGLATPLAIWTGLVAAAQRGVVVRSASVLERVAGVRRMLFDKTGTLTTTVPRVAHVDALGDASPDEVLAVAASLEVGIVHPVARGIVAAAQARGVACAAATALAVVPGRGVRGVIGRRTVVVGGPAWVGELATGIERLPRRPGTAVAVARDGRVVGGLWLEEALALGASAAIAELRGLGLSVGLLSGDVRATVLGRDFAPGEVAIGLRPEDKVARVRAARRHDTVAMVGDGFNDAPALAAADVGIAVGDATDLTRVTADVVVVHGGVGQVPWLVRHARLVVRVARQNLAWAFGYNALAVGLAATGRLSPLVAALAMLASSLAVVANARRLRAPEATPRAAPSAAHDLLRAA